MGLQQEYIEKITTWLRGYPEIIFAYLYGSAADSANFRDVDIGVFVDRSQVPEAQDTDFAFALADGLDPLLPYPLDVRVINAAPLIFQYNVINGLLLFTHSDEIQSNFVERTWDMYLDFRPIAMQYLRDFR